MIIPQQELFGNDSTAVLTIPEADLLQAMRTKGILLTPAEYTNNLVSYYNTLIAFLSVFFVVFTVFGYVIVRNQSKKEVRDEAREILLDSTSFRKRVIDDMKGEFDLSYLTHDDYDGTLKTMQEDIASLKEQLEAKDSSSDRNKKQTVAPRKATKSATKAEQVSPTEKE